MIVTIGEYTISTKIIDTGSTSNKLCEVFKKGKVVKGLFFKDTDSDLVVVNSVTNILLKEKQKTF